MSPNELVLRSLYERSFQRMSVENASMDIDYKDLTSLELEENIEVVSVKESSPNRNHLSSLSPNSKKSSTGDCSDSSYMLLSKKYNSSFVGGLGGVGDSQQHFSSMDKKSLNGVKPQLQFKHRSFNMLECPALEHKSLEED